MGEVLIKAEEARELYCPESMASPAGPIYCRGDDCIAWRAGTCRWVRS